MATSAPSPANQASDNPSKPGYLALVCFALTGAGLVAWHLHFSYQLFAEMDGGVLVNAAWQEYQGAVPYRDFFTASPPLFLLPAGWAFRIFGPTWGSLTILVCLFSVWTYAWLSWLLWRVTGSVWKAMGYSLAVQVLTFMPNSWWWYNSNTEVVAAIFFAAIGGLVTRPHDRVIRLSFILAEALVGLGKPNIAGPLLILGIAFLLTIRSLRGFAIKATLAAAVLDVAFLASQGISVAPLLQNYTEGSGGRFSPNTLYFVLTHPGVGSLTILMIETIAGLAVTIFLAIHFTPATDRPARAHQLILLGLAVLIALCGFVTNNDFKTVDVPCLVVVLAFVELPSAVDSLSPARLAYGFAQMLLASLLLWNLVTGATRWGFYISSASYAPPELRVTLPKVPLFRGMQVSPHLAEVLGDVSAVLNEHGLLNDPTKKIFFGPRVDFCYPAFNIADQRGLPLWWEGVPSTRGHREYPIGTDNPPGAFHYPYFPPGHAVDPRVQRFIDVKFDACIFRVNDSLPDMSFLPADLRAEIYEHCYLEYHSLVVIFIPRGQPWQ